MIVYHGSTEVVEKPDVLHSYRSLDFGKGFYAATNKVQAGIWAKRKAVIKEAGLAVINIYHMKEDFSELNNMDFGENLSEWIDFVCHCRDGGQDYKSYDLISGKVANDKVYRVVDMYYSGLWDKERAIREIKTYPNYDQTAFITQKAIDHFLTFESYEEVKIYG